MSVFIICIIFYFPPHPDNGFTKTLRMANTSCAYVRLAQGLEMLAAAANSTLQEAVFDSLLCCAARRVYGMQSESAQRASIAAPA